MKVYISAPSTHVGDAESAMRQARARGDIVVGDWTPSVRMHGSQGTRLDPYARAAIVTGWAEAIGEADAVLALSPADAAPSEGAAYECALADMAGLPRVVVCQRPVPRLIYASGWVVVREVAAGLHALESCVRRGMR